MAWGNHRQSLSICYFTCFYRSLSFQLDNKKHPPADMLNPNSHGQNYATHMGFTFLALGGQCLCDVNIYWILVHLSVWGSLWRHCVCPPKVCRNSWAFYLVTFLTSSSNTGTIGFCRANLVAVSVCWVCLRRVSPEELLVTLILCVMSLENIPTRIFQFWTSQGTRYLTYIHKVVLCTYSLHDGSFLSISSKLHDEGFGGTEICITFEYSK